MRCQDHGAGTVGDAIGRIRGNIIQKLGDRVGRVPGGMCLLGAERAEGGQEFVVNGAGIIQQRAKDSLQH